MSKAKEKHKILIIDDEKALLEMFETKFKKEGFAIHIETNGLSGLTKASEIKPDLILLDIMMPGIDGVETLKAFKKCTSLNTKIVIFSNLSETSDNIKDAMELGADEYLLKANFTPGEIVEHVKKLIKEEKK